MRFLIYNDKALWSGIMGVLAGLGMASFSKNALISVATGGAVATLADLIGRIRDGEASPALFHPDAGGHLYFLPVWIVGLATALIGGASWMGLI